MTISDNEMQELLDESARELGIVGAQLAYYDGEHVKEFATGIANQQTSTPVTNDTVFQVGSTTKVFNATIIMSLVDDGLLDLDEPIITYLPEISFNDDRAKEITLRRLLSMSSGLPNGPYSDHGRGDDCVARYVASLADIELLFPPGSAFGYSNAGTIVAGHIAERVTGQLWDDLLRQRVLDKLGLRHSATLLEELVFHPVAVGHTPMDETFEIIRKWGITRAIGPAGSVLCCSAGDLVRFGQMFLRSGRADDGQPVVSAEAVAAMQQPQVYLPVRLVVDRWGVGPYGNQWDGYDVWGHSGTNTGGSSMLLWVPEKNVAAATLVNVPPKGYPLAEVIFNELFPKVFNISKPPPERPTKSIPIDIDRYVGTFRAHEVEYTISHEGGQLTLQFTVPAHHDEGQEMISTVLLPLDEDRFFPPDPHASGGRMYDVAFWGTDETGRATHFLNGVFAAKRVG